MNLARVDIFLIDIPVSAVLDTLFLPFDIRANVHTLQRVQGEPTRLMTPRRTTADQNAHLVEPGPSIERDATSAR